MCEVLTGEKIYHLNLLHLPRPQLLGASLGDSLSRSPCDGRHSISSRADQNGWLGAVTEVHYAAQSQKCGYGDD
jgi:hypothetical protein